MMPGGINPRQMQHMMKQLGIKSEELDVKRVIFQMDGKDLIIDSPSVTAVNMQGKKTYTVMGAAREEIAGLPEEDVKMVMQQAGVKKKEAEKALEECNGDIAEAIMKLKG